MRPQSCNTSYNVGAIRLFSMLFSLFPLYSAVYTNSSQLEGVCLCNLLLSASELTSWLDRVDLSPAWPHSFGVICSLSTYVINQTKAVVREMKIILINCTNSCDRRERILYKRPYCYTHWSLAHWPQIHISLGKYRLSDLKYIYRVNILCFMIS